MVITVKRTSSAGGISSKRAVVGHVTGRFLVLLDLDQAGKRT